LEDKPYPNEHACRLRDPDDFKRIRSQERTVKEPPSLKGKTYRALYGWLKKPEGDRKTADQAYRYAIDEWTEAEAKLHCKENKGKFEPAVNTSAYEDVDGVLGAYTAGIITRDEARSLIEGWLDEAEKRAERYRREAEQLAVRIIERR